MQESTARARLVDSTGNGTSVLTTIPRAELENALQFEDGPPDLVLDVMRYTGEGEARTSDTGQVNVSWSREDLEEILRRSKGEGVTISFDADELLRAFDADVEAHGIREVAAVLAVAVAAGTAAGVAAGQPAEGAGTGTAAAAAQADYGMPRAMPEDYAAQPGEYGAPRAMPSDYASQPGEYGAPRAMPSDYASQPDEYGMPRAMPADYEAPAEYGMPRAMPADYEAPAEYGMPRAMPADYAQPTGDGGIHVSLPSPEVTGALAGGAALLLITGAAFAANRRRITPAT
jgi:hypothetical protein